MLAARTILDQGITVEGINFFTGFCVEGHTHAIRRRGGSSRPAPRNNALWVADKLGIKLHLVEVVEEYKSVVLNPRHGYGRNLNPCLDCKGFMVRKAHEWMLENDFDFIITGEVVGQRPMSQRRDTMPVIAEESGAGDRLLRPLSAQGLPETFPERAGWVDRSRLHGFHGRTRKPQMALAAELGLDEYAQPAGGCCFLTDQRYSVKLQDLWRSRGRRDYELDDIMLLKVGRHLRPKPHFKLIIGREDGENRFLRGYRHLYPWLRTVSHPGPITLFDGPVLEPVDLELAARITARFSQGRSDRAVALEVGRPGEEPSTLSVAPLSPGEVQPEWYL